MKHTNRCSRTVIGAALAAASAIGLSSVAWAAIQSTGGQVTQIASPPSVELHMLESNTTLFAFNERQCVTLAAALRVSISTPGTYTYAAQMITKLIPAGTKVSSQFIQADKIGPGGTQIVLEGTLNTDATILGLIVRQAHLDASDYLGAIGTVYPTGNSGRVLQLNGKNDTIVLDPSMQSVTVRTMNSQHADQLRVITECKLPPPPPTGFQGCTPGYWKQDQHFDSWQGYATTDLFNTVFGVAGPLPNTLTLLDALNLGGGGINALARHAVAALLGSVHSEVEYGLSQADVLDQVKAAINSNDATTIEALKNQLDALNNKGCSLN